MTGVSAGQVSIRAALNEEIYAECIVNVLSNQISLDQSSIKISKGTTVTLVVTTVPPGQPVTWTSSDETVATVTQSGAVTGLKAGDAIITATLADGTFVECVIIVRCSGTLNYASSDVDVGDSLTLELTTIDTIDITWTSSNPYVATVSSDGVVTGIKAGSTTITASSRHLMKSQSCTIFVTIQDGVYYIQNLNSDYYLHVPYGDIQNGIGLVQNKLLSSQYYGEHEMIRQMWRIKHLNAGEYSIRPMLLPQMCLCVDVENQIFLSDRDTIDSDYFLERDARWKISSTGSGVVITSDVFHKNSVQIDGDSLAVGANVNAAPRMESNSAVWFLIRIEQPPTGVALLDVSTGKILPYSIQLYLALKEEWSLEAKGLIAVSYSSSNISQRFEWTTTDSSIVSVDDNGKVFGTTEGNAVITATSLANGLKINFLVSILPIANGTYLIKNWHNGCFVTASAQSNTDGSDQVFLSSHGTQVNTMVNTLKYNLQAWVISSYGNGYYTFQLSELKSFYLAVVKDSDGNNYVDLLMCDSEIPYEAQWSIQQTPNGSLKITPRSMLEPQIVLSADTGSSGENIPFTLCEYTLDLDFSDEWELADWGAFIGTKSPELTVSVQLLGELYSDPEWHALVIRAVNIWNQSIPEVKISIVDNAATIKMSLVDEPEVNWAGRAMQKIVNGVYQAEIFINTAKEYSDSIKLHVILHEIGHLFGLKDNPPVDDPNDSLMHYDANQEEILSPCAYDIFNIKFLYNIE